MEALYSEAFRSSFCYIAYLCSVSIFSVEGFKCGMLSNHHCCFDYVDNKLSMFPSYQITCLLAL